MKLSRVVEVALNGDAPQVDPAVRRTLYSLADSIDDSNRQLREEFQDGLKELREDNKSLKHLLYGTAATVISGVVATVLSILLTS